MLFQSHLLAMAASGSTLLALSKYATIQRCAGDGKDFGIMEIFCSWVPELLMDKQRRTSISASSQLSQQHAAKGDDFLLNTVTGDKS
jgi:hypothetical protein